jgi:pimeloyl-ACP methyl ester carboxylesterase
MQLCLRHPERCSALVLLVPATFAPRKDGDTPPERSPILVSLMNATLRSDFLFWTFTKLPKNIVLQTILGTPPEAFREAPPEEQAEALATIRRILPMKARARGLENDAEIVSSLPRYDLESLRAPTLLISTEDDLYGTFPGARYAAEHIPNARFLGFSTGGHLLLGHGKEMATQIAEFLAMHPPTVDRHSAM